MTDTIDLDLCFKVVNDVARAAGVMISEVFHDEKQVELKSSMADLVTETDQNVEKMIIGTLKEKFPSHSFIGEESVAAGEKCDLTDNPTWVIDPIDGTTNFVHSFPFSAVSIGLLVNKEAEIGLVYNPIADEMFTARKGQGAFLNGKKLKCTKTEEMGQALICAEFGSSRNKEILDSKFNSMRKVIEKAHGIRSVGSAACSMSLVARGSVDAYFEVGIHCWDIAAGEIIVREAGGVCIDLGGGPLDLMSRRVICAGTEKLAQEIARTVEPLEMERD